MKLYPSLLTSSIEQYQQQLALVLESGAIKVIQVDVIDGQFADNLTLTPADLVGIDHGELKIDFHLMTQEPVDYVRELAAIKNELPVRAVIAQVERMSSFAEYIEEVKTQDWKVGLSLDLYTPVSAIDNNIWVDIDVIQLMTIEAGFQGQEFNLRALEKITHIKKLTSKELEIVIDGGVKSTQLKTLAHHQVNGIVVGSGIWQAADPVAAMQQYS